MLLVSGACQMSGALSAWTRCAVLMAEAQNQNHVERMHMEQEQLAERTGKLETFYSERTFKQLPHQEQNHA